MTSPDTGLSPGWVPSHNACPSPQPRGQTSRGNEGHSWATPGSMSPSPGAHSTVHAPSLPPTRCLGLHPLPQTHHTCRSWDARSELEAPDSGWSSPLALWSGQGRRHPNTRCVLTSRYSRSVSFSSWEVWRIWHKGNRWERVGEGRDPGKIPVRRALPVRLWVSGPWRAQPRGRHSPGGRKAGGDDPELQLPPRDFNLL